MSFRQSFVPVPVQPCVQQKRSGYGDAQPFVKDIACMAVGHEQEEHDDHEDVRHGLYRHAYLQYPFRFTGMEHGEEKRRTLAAANPDGKEYPGNALPDLQDRQERFTEEDTISAKSCLIFARLRRIYPCGPAVIFMQEIAAAHELHLLRRRGGVSHRSTPGAFSNRKCSECHLFFLYHHI